eukprot:9478438-Pyramimonas_sp.AAC.1
MSELALLSGPSPLLGHRPRPGCAEAQGAGDAGTGAESIAPWRPLMVTREMPCAKDSFYQRAMWAPSGGTV